MESFAKSKKLKVKKFTKVMFWLQLWIIGSVLLENEITSTKKLEEHLNRISILKE